MNPKLHTPLTIKLSMCQQWLLGWQRNNQANTTAMAHLQSLIQLITWTTNQTLAYKRMLSETNPEEKSSDHSHTLELLHSEGDSLNHGSWKRSPHTDVQNYCDTSIGRTTYWMEVNIRRSSFPQFSLKTMACVENMNICLLVYLLPKA